MPKLLAAPHRTVKAWKRPRRNRAWLILLIALGAIGFFSYARKVTQRERRMRPVREREAQRRMRERFEEALRKANLRTRPSRKAAWAALAQEQTQAARRAGVPAKFENHLGMRFVLVPEGPFVMGSPEGEAGRDAGEMQHSVTLSQPYYVSTTEVTNQQFRRFRGGHRSQAPAGLPDANGEHLPVTSVAHDAALAFCGWLTANDRQGRTYRLPTEAEWERACRGGVTDAYPWGRQAGRAGRYANVADMTARAQWPARIGDAVQSDPSWAWFETSDAHPGLAPVARFAPNRFGLYDMIGNAAEWCADWAGPYDVEAARDPRGPARGRQRVFRGGAFDTSRHRTRSASRGAEFPPARVHDLGFRVVADVKRP